MYLYNSRLKYYQDSSFKIYKVAFKYIYKIEGGKEK